MPNVTVDRFKVGRDLEINIEVRPRTQSGVLVAVHGRMDFLVLQLVDGKVSHVWLVALPFEVLGTTDVNVLKLCTFLKYFLLLGMKKKK